MVKVESRFPVMPTMKPLDTVRKLCEMKVKGDVTLFCFAEQNILEPGLLWATCCRGNFPLAVCTARFPQALTVDEERAPAPFRFLAFGLTVCGLLLLLSTCTALDFDRTEAAANFATTLVLLFLSSDLSLLLFLL